MTPELRAALENALDPYVWESGTEYVVGLIEPVIDAAMLGATEPYVDAWMAEGAKRALLAAADDVDREGYFFGEVAAWLRARANGA